MFLVTLTPAAHRPIRDAQDLGRFPPFQLAGHGLQNHFLYLHHPLHFCSRDLLFDGFHINQLSPRCVSSGHFTCYLTRTTHMLPTSQAHLYCIGRVFALYFAVPRRARRNLAVERQAFATTAPGRCCVETNALEDDDNGTTRVSIPAGCS